MIGLGVILAWTALAGLVSALAWRRIRRHVKVYLLIVASGAYLGGLFALYALVYGLPM